MAATPGGDGATKREIQLEIVEDFTSKMLESCNKNTDSNRNIWEIRYQKQ
jgi:hypothetical protein